MTTKAKTDPIHRMGQLIWDWLEECFPEDDLEHNLEVIGVYNDLMQAGGQDAERIIRRLRESGALDHE